MMKTDRLELAPREPLRQRIPAGKVPAPVNIYTINFPFPRIMGLNYAYIPPEQVSLRLHALVGAAGKPHLTLTLTSSSPHPHLTLTAF